MSNYTPHNKWEHRDTNGGDKVEQYLLNLSKTVGKACDKWLESRGIVSRQFQGSARYNETKSLMKPHEEAGSCQVKAL